MKPISPARLKKSKLRLLNSIPVIGYAIRKIIAVEWKSDANITNNANGITFLSFKNLYETKITPIANVSLTIFIVP